MKSELLKRRKMSLRLRHSRELFNAIQLASYKTTSVTQQHTHTHSCSNDLLGDVFYSRGAPVEFGEDAPSQGVYGLQHTRGEFGELWSLSGNGDASETRGDGGRGQTIHEGAEGRHVTE